MNILHVTHHQESQRLMDEKTTFGFWIYIMSDCLVFASLFATYAVLHSNTFGGPAASNIFSLPFVFVETLILLTSSFTYGLVILSSHHNKREQALMWLAVTFLLGATFVALELNEFSTLVSAGNGWQRSGFLSAYFTLVGTHGIHVTAGLVWMMTLILHVKQHGLAATTKRRMWSLGLFWHFLDIIWIFIFTIVYLMGVLL